MWKTHFPHLVWKTSGLYVLPVRLFCPVRLLGPLEYNTAQKEAILVVIHIHAQFRLSQSDEDNENCTSS